jgi:hypothetical protein
MPSTNIRYQVLLGSLATSADNKGAVQAVGLPPLQPVVYTANNPKTGKEEFAELRVQYHMFPEFPDVRIVNDWVVKLKAQMDRPAADLSSVTIQVGTGESDTGFFMLTPYGGSQLLETNIGKYVYIAETQGEDAALRDFRKTLEGKGLL